MSDTATTSISPEAHLLLQCVRAFLDSLSDSDLSGNSDSPATPTSTIPIPPDSINWHSLLDLATRHNVMPLLYRGLQIVCPDAVPSETMRYLHHQFHLNARYNQQRSRELCNIVQLFAAHNIPAVPYKGPALAALLYGDTALRQFGDLDILVHYWNILSARDLLIAQGYLHEPHERYIRECVLVHAESKTWVELQWHIVAHQRLLTSFQFEVSRLHERTIDILLDGKGSIVPTLSPPDMLLVLCAHASSHIWDQLQYICDIARLVQRYHAEIAWEQVITHARQLRCERLLLLSLALAQELLGRALPQPVAQRIATEPLIPVLTAQVAARLFDPRGFSFHKRQAAEIDSPIGLFASEGYLLQIKTREQWQDRFAYVIDYFLCHAEVATTLTTQDRQMVALPTVLTFLYYPLRMLRLCNLYGWHLLKQPLKSLSNVNWLIVR